MVTAQSVRLTWECHRTEVDHRTGTRSCWVQRFAGDSVLHDLEKNSSHGPSRNWKCLIWRNHLRYRLTWGEKLGTLWMLRTFLLILSLAISRRSMHMVKMTKAHTIQTMVLLNRKQQVRLAAGFERNFLKGALSFYRNLLESDSHVGASLLLSSQQYLCEHSPQQYLWVSLHLMFWV